MRTCTLDIFVVSVIVAIRLVKSSKPLLYQHLRVAQSAPPSRERQLRFHRFLTIRMLPLWTVDLAISGARYYKRRCKIRAPCYNDLFDCRHCHNEAKNSDEINPLDHHDIPSHQVKKFICSLCETEQDVQQYCINCGKCMGKYFCATCKFFYDDISFPISKNQYHCDECGICRTGGKENFFHCKRCGCYSKVMKDGHRCVEKAMHHNCAVCFEFLFDTLRDVSVLPCGHTIHLDCVKEMEKHYSPSVFDMSSLWKKLDQVVWILCNDCGANCEVQFHIVAHKCQSCNSYNTYEEVLPPHHAQCLRW